MKGLLFQQQQQQQAVDENMSNLTSASGEAASVSSGNRTEIGTNYPQYFAPPPQTQPLKRKRNLPGNPGNKTHQYHKLAIRFFYMHLIT